MTLTGGRPLTRSALGALETQIGHELPVEYRAFLLREGGGEPQPNAYSHHPRFPAVHRVHRFFAGDELPAELGRATARAALGFLPIAATDEGNLFLGLTGARRGLVYVPLSDDPENLFWLSEGLQAFLRRLSVPGEKPAPPPQPAPRRAARWSAPRGKLPTPLPLTEAGYRRLVVAKLHALLPALADDLRDRVFELTFPEGTESFELEIHTRDLDEVVPIVGYLMDGQRGQVQIRKEGRKAVLAPNVAILPKVKAVIPARELARFRKAGMDLTHGDLLLSWFVAGWKTAGGARCFNLPARISFHDDTNAVVLPSRGARG
jgi:hypothetical protein